ncbi:MAG TPA: hypothetical protein VKV41_08925 [Methylomirabilota bacterium]|jgi:hypothetical protein|nr:hypothetical protein [Methylomirabilota bacterium]
MCFDPYVLERITTSRLEELRAEAARRGVVRSIHGPGRILARLRALFTGRHRVIAGRGGAVRTRHA